MYIEFSTQHGFFETLSQASPVYFLQTRTLFSAYTNCNFSAILYHRKVGIHMEFNNKKIFESTPDNFRESKIRYLDQLEKFITDKQAECKAYRDEAVSPEKMYADRESFVRAYEDMIGLYKPEVSGIPAHTQEKIGEDD